MRALHDSNTPKIVKEDEVVFLGLLSVLFPGINPPRKTDESLESFVRKVCTKLGNHPMIFFVCIKVIQLLGERPYVTVFLLGPAGAGKSQCWRTLKEAHQAQPQR
jgi:dynein heavy chain